jgi:GTPase SAR1 family protein
VKLFQIVQVSLWDTAGSERYHFPIPTIHLQDLVELLGSGSAKEEPSNAIRASFETVSLAS